MKSRHNTGVIPSVVTRPGAGRANAARCVALHSHAGVCLIAVQQLARQPNGRAGGRDIGCSGPHMGGAVVAIKSRREPFRTPGFPTGALTVPSNSHAGRLQERTGAGALVV
jgi:hypothetical protein